MATDRCPAGHPFTDENTYITPYNSRQCRTCKRERMRELREKPVVIQREKESEREYYARVRRPAHFLRKYGITLDQLAAMEAAQKGKCAICKEKQPLVVDHCHATGQVRKLLCHRCNKVLGLVKEDPTVLKNMIRYCVPVVRK